jgi:hypothetical protein
MKALTSAAAPQRKKSDVIGLILTGVFGFATTFF